MLKMPMYVCSCNALSDADVHRVIGEYGVDRPAAVFAACNCRAQCGICVPSVCALLKRRTRSVNQSGCDIRNTCQIERFTVLNEMETLDAT